jgi:hypothetical protein
VATQASQDNGCGTYSYEIVGSNSQPTSNSTPPPATATLLQMNCFPPGKSGVNEATELLNARDACGSTMNKDSQPLTATYSVGNHQNNYKISWQPNCTRTAGNVNFQATMGDAQYPSETQLDCPTMLYYAYKKCKLRFCLLFRYVDLTLYR